MKLRILSYRQNFSRKFKQEKSKILKVIKDYEIHHIGSTAVPRLGGKGIIDIMIGIKNWEEAEEVIKKLKDLGFIHIHPKEKGGIFLSKDPGLFPLKNVHIHIVKTGSKVYEDRLAFRNYLRKNKKEIDRFYKLKIKWLKQSKGNRKKYNKLKEKYIKNILKAGLKI